MAQEPASRAHNSSPDTSAAEAGSAGGVAPDERSGQDERRRGWFWHWNGIVTQYTPLIGLKGIGLLNSYTVWTDRREDSPHRGYAFPSQQSEANFYGEDRSELITINKILVALDLIEIRKEMVRKTDAQGRRWKVPQNLYRVKDRQDGIDLTTADVIRVIELAERDKAVYRYVRKVFSTRFEPIDRNNVWHGILEELDSHPTWSKLAARAAKQEARASARTKAGHRSRARQQEQAGLSPEAPQGSGTIAAHDKAARADGATPGSSSAAVLTTGHIDDRSLLHTEQRDREPAVRPTTVDAAINGSGSADDASNNGIKPADEPGNIGFSKSEGGTVAHSNEGCESSVEPGNTMYYQSSSTTTTTTTSPIGADNETRTLEGSSSNETAFQRDQRQDPSRDADHSANANGKPSTETYEDVGSGNGTTGERAPESGLAGAPGAGPLGDPSALVLSLYEAANDRGATRLERILLSELEADAEVAAEAVGSSGSEWVAAALREAVGSGSAFVAPKRIREIVNRWKAAGVGPRGELQIDEIHESSDSLFTKQQREESREHDAVTNVLSVSPADAAQGDRLWGVVLDMLAVGKAAPDLFRLRGVLPLGEREDGAFVLGAPTRVAARLLEDKHRDAVEQALSSLLPTPVTITALDPAQWSIEG